MLRHRNDLERKLNKSNTALAEQIDRETKALAKIQEVLGLAEAATEERNAAIEREKETKGLKLQFARLNLFNLKIEYFQKNANILQPSSDRLWKRQPASASRTWKGVRIDFKKQLIRWRNT